MEWIQRRTPRLILAGCFSGFLFLRGIVCYSPTDMTKRRIFRTFMKRSSIGIGIIWRVVHFQRDNLEGSPFGGMS